MCSRPGPRSSSRMKHRPSTISVVVAAVRPSSSVPPKTCRRGSSRAASPGAIAGPGGHREGGERPQEAPAVQRALARRECEHERGDADRQQGRDRQLARQEGEREPEDRGEQDQDRGVDRLGRVQAAEAVDVARDPATLADGARQHRELVAEQDDVGDPLGDLAAGSHRHGQPGLLERRDVVDAVADHPREAAPLREGADQGLLLVRA